MDTAKIKVIIVEDEVLIARHIEEILIDGGYHVLGITHDSEKALDLISSQQPEVVILDINICGSKDGIEVAESINGFGKTAIIFLTALSDIHTLERAKKVNPAGYIIKPFKPSDLLSSITIGLYNYEFIRKKKVLTIEGINNIANRPMSTIEFDILMDIKDGLTNSQIAKKRFIALSTVKWHANNIYSKLNVNNRTSAIKAITSS